jgi:hypothetical protein
MQLNNFVTGGPACETHRAQAEGNIMALPAVLTTDREDTSGHKLRGGAVHTLWYAA